ncbi:ferritin heavy chain, oocyte isoform-like [Ambystoma mexicanum]|uniref:ferritin heavy chain, oocyte isoform-like n=1 Tax=Ambystoma mexicanum TaxID=8296 RepID=UPI0037E789BF
MKWKLDKSEFCNINFLIGILASAVTWTECSCSNNAWTEPSVCSSPDYQTFQRSPSITISSQVRRNYHQDCEAAINLQINLELYASCVYLSMSYYFDPDDVALKNFAKFFLHQSHEEREHPEKLMKLQNQRGGRIFLQDVKKLECDECGDGLEAMEGALPLEKSVNQSLLDLHKLATDRNDPNLCDFLETHYLEEQVKSIKELGDHVTNLWRMGAPQNDLTEYLFDKHTLGEESSLVQHGLPSGFVSCIHYSECTSLLFLFI